MNDHVQHGVQAPIRDSQRLLLSTFMRAGEGILRGLTAAGVRVPGEIAVTGFDDLYPARLANPPLTTVRQPMHLLGERACARLLDRIARPSLSPSVQLLPTELVLRSSCGCPPGTATRQTVQALKPATTEPSQ